MSTKQTPESFWARIKIGGPNDCWEWQGSCNNTGYGSCAWRGTVYTAHRIAAYLSGLVPSMASPKNRKSGGFVLHTCDNPKCCNPRHFEIGTYAANQEQAYARERRSAFKGETHALAKLTNAQAQEIRKRYAKGDVYQKDLAREHGVSQRVICLITRGETYV